MNTIYFQTFETRPDYFFYYDVTWKSVLSVLRPTDRVVLIDAGASPEMLARVPSRFEIVHDHKTWPGVWCGIEYTLRSWRNTEGPPDDQILLLDSRDMLFQRNPFDDLLPGLTIMSEGILHGTCAWNQGDHAAVRQHIAASVPEAITNWPVLCPAVYGGNRRMTRWLALMFGHMGTMQIRGGTDQGSLNYMVNQWLLKGDKDVRICDPNTNDWCLGGHDFRAVSPPCEYRDGLICCGATKRPYALVHQWDRTAWREATLGKWGLKC